MDYEIKRNTPAHSSGEDEALRMGGGLENLARAAAAAQAAEHLGRQTGRTFSGDQLCSKAAELTALGRTWGRDTADDMAVLLAGSSSNRSSRQSNHKPMQCATCHTTFPNRAASYEHTRLTGHAAFTLDPTMHDGRVTAAGVHVSAAPGGRHRAFFKYRNKATGQDGSFATETSDLRAVCDDATIRTGWIEDVKRQHAQNEGWSLSDTEISLVTQADTNKGRCKVEIGFSNNRTGDVGGAYVMATKEPAQQGQDAWLEDVKKQHARERGWRYEDTSVWIVGVESSAQVEKQSSSPSNRSDTQHATSAPTASELDTHKVEQLSAALAEMKGHTSAKVCRNTLRKYASNLQKKSSNPIFRKINLQNQAFQSRVAAIPGGLDWLVAIGFQAADGQLEISEQAIDCTLLQHAIEVLADEDEVEALYE